MPKDDIQNICVSTIYSIIACVVCLGGYWAKVVRLIFDFNDATCSTRESTHTHTVIIVISGDTAKLVPMCYSTNLVKTVHDFFAA